jgi:hypothetical protein
MKSYSAYYTCMGDTVMVILYEITNFFINVVRIVLRWIYYRPVFFYYLKGLYREIGLAESGTI